MVPDAAHLLQGIDLAIEVDGERLTVTLVELFSIERELLKKAHSSLADQEDEIRRGLERLFTGF